MHLHHMTSAMDVICHISFPELIYCLRGQMSQSIYYPIMLLHSIIGYCHHTVMRLSVCPSVCDVCSVALRERVSGLVVGGTGVI